MDKFYSVEKNVQMLVYLLKAHGIKKVVASPGTTNLCFVGSLQNDSFFEVYSAADERQAAYMACGLAAESGEPVVITCTGATASRNYIPGLTEAFYRKLPVLAVTATQHIGRIGQNIAQVIDRRVIQNDIAKYSLQLPTIHDAEDEWAYGVKINEALLELRHNGGGPVHINLTTQYSRDYSVKELPPVKVIRRLTLGENFPSLQGKKVGIFVGSHKAWSEELTAAVDEFCAKYDSVVLCDHTSNYTGKYRVFFSLVANQMLYDAPVRHVDVMIDMGDVSGAYGALMPAEVWRINPDGAVRDTYRKLTKVFQMKEVDFFKQMNTEIPTGNHIELLTAWQEENARLAGKIPELPFSNVWIAQQTAAKLPQDCVLHLGILNSLRAWNFFAAPESVLNYANTGGFGIDGCLSALIGASLAHKDKLYFGVIGDLAFFYDMNALGNHHLGRNVRLMLINNGRGTEFRNFNHPAQVCFGEDADAYMAAAGHYGNQSRNLVKHYAEDLGCEYLTADSKESYLANLERFLTAEITERPMVFEVFTDSQLESDALDMIYHIEKTAKGQAKEAVRNILGTKGTATVKKLLGR
ncbi:2-succinyl-5-enolpyruvyl-6-hydroxy-3-cyclohexene-1-carboxylate synthase [Selenomonas ruminantium]|uniref:2-succinyl-5-enolpyruvyl-6-hydroxy-3-cyclohexene-1-carboxylate synthase n=2 Tax=Selenomonas ruminantium TaxID=971 RepID=A0A1H0UFE7_SELRU|nr:2-succinyl-5-enolpyruvyl-6-hydroxy-3-cyclohexene-1-carboxylate synthase [Selenomonas ruminantium]